MAEDLLKRRELIAAGSRVTGGPPLIKEIGTDALFALHIVADHMDRHLGTSVLPKVRGAKAHTTASPFANELIVLPTRAMAESDADYAVSFAIPAATGLTTPSPRTSR